MEARRNPSMSVVERAFHDALDHSAEAPQAFLARACDDDRVRREVEFLLNHDVPTEFLVTPDCQEDDPRPVGSADTLSIGQRLGVYEVRALIGTGGMGEVYQARDIRLDRDVAIKVLSRASMARPDRRLRFEREARILATLNHPHIGTIYGLEEGSGHLALVMELVQGDTLADRIARGPVAVSDALAWVRQIAEALGAAHEKRIIHRDLKPANVKITVRDVVKVLDFGVARVEAGPVADDELPASPTITANGGVIVGTVAYMSPEQARGQTVDRRTDIWAFGCLFYELLTGRPAFAGPTLSDTIAAVLISEPDWTALPTRLPSKVVTLLRQCLEKDVTKRPRHIADVLADLTRAVTRPAIAPARGDAVASGSILRKSPPWMIPAAAQSL